MGQYGTELSPRTVTTKKKLFFPHNGNLRFFSPKLRMNFLVLLLVQAAILGALGEEKTSALEKIRQLSDCRKHYVDIMSSSSSAFASESSSASESSHGTSNDDCHVDPCFECKVSQTQQFKDLASKMEAQYKDLASKMEAQFKDLVSKIAKVEKERKSFIRFKSKLEGLGYFRRTLRRNLS